jgi:hypothetical protein
MTDIKFKGDKLMISKDAIEKIVSDALPRVDGYQLMIETIISKDGCSNFQGAASLLLGLLQTIFTCSSPGEAKDDLDTLKEIFKIILDKADVKYPEWDAKRLDKFKKEIDKANTELSRFKGKPKRDAGDNIH